jgi:hypothetical protein
MQIGLNIGPADVPDLDEARGAIFGTGTEED